jgi:hypothetical protein
MKYTIRTYDELNKYTQAFAKGAYGLLFLIGNPGQAKSKSLHQTMDKRDGQHMWVEGTVSAFKLYQKLWDHRHQPIVMDDVDSIYTDRNLVRLLKCLCNTESSKTVSWNTDSRQLDALEIPNEFVTRSKVCIIANHWRTLTQHVGSLADRGFMIHFEPSPEEIHRKAKTFFKDEEILDFIAQYLPCLSDGQLSLRMYVNAEGAKNKGQLDWKRPLLETMGLLEVSVFHELINDPSYATGERRMMEFCKRTGLSRPKWFETQKQHKLLEDLLPKIKTKAKAKKAKPKKQVLVGTATTRTSL